MSPVARINAGVKALPIDLRPTPLLIRASAMRYGHGWVRGTHYATFVTKVAGFSCSPAMNLRIIRFSGMSLRIVAIALR